MANFTSISGTVGSGKTTIVDHFKSCFSNKFYTTSDFSFAGPLKDTLCLWFGWDRQRLDHDHAYKEGSLLDDGSPDPYCQALGMTRREIMQKFGTECMRYGMKPDFWIILADIGLRLNKIPAADLYFIPDARMRNELEWIKQQNGYCIYIERVECALGEDPKHAVNRSLTKSASHPSEQEFVAWDKYDEKIVNLIDHNKTENANMNALMEHLRSVTIPAIRTKFNLIGKYYQSI